MTAEPPISHDDRTQPLHALRTICQAIVPTTNAGGTGHHVTAPLIAGTSLTCDRLLDAISSSIIITNPNLPDNPIIYCNPAFEHLTGYSAAEVLGGTCGMLHGQETDPAALNTLQTAIAAGQACTQVLKQYRKDGGWFWSEIQITPVRSAGGQVVFYIAVLHDVTERKRLEAQFLHAQKMESIGRLAGSVAHDFNNVLTAILGYTELALGGLPADSPVQNDLQQIQFATIHASQLTRQLLAFARKQPNEPATIQLNALLIERQQFLRQLVGEDIDLLVHTTPTAVSTRVDPAQLEQVIVNMVINARDAMPAGGTLLIETDAVILDENYARMHVGVSPGTYALLSISDTGIGMDENTRQHMFEPFFTTKEPGKGTGLGLATSYGIITQHGGYIWYYSEIGQGTTFKIYLPLVSTAHQQAATEERVSDLPRGNETILLVEDQPHVRQLIARALSNHGYTVLQATNGLDALRLLERHPGPPDLLLTDVVMPHVNGQELAKRLLRRHPQLKVLFTSGYTATAMTRDGRLTPDAAFLDKPFTTVSLIQQVRRILDGDPA